MPRSWIEIKRESMLQLEIKKRRTYAVKLGRKKGRTLMCSFFVFLGRCED